MPLDYKGLISQIRSMGKNVRVRLKEYSYAHGNRELEFLGNFAVATFSSRHYRIRYVAIKRIFDIVCGNDNFYSNVFYYGNRFTYRRRSR